MAIDSKEKRQGITGVGRPYIRDKFPVVAKDEEWRIFSGLAYGGNALSAVESLFDYFSSRRSSQKWHRSSNNP